MSVEISPHVESIFVKWINTFQIPRHCSNLDDLDDGVLLSHVFHQIAPPAFDTLEDVGNNTLLKYTNLRRLLTNIKNYGEAELGVEVTCDLGGGTSIDQAVLQSDITHLIRLALVCAIRCENNAMFVPTIMQFPAHDQQILMTIIQETESEMVVVSRDDDSVGQGPAAYDLDDWGDSHLRAQDTAMIAELTEEKEHLVKKIAELKAKINQLEHDKLEWQTQTKNLQSELALQTPGRKVLQDERSQMDDELRDQIDELEYALSQKELEANRIKKQLMEEIDRRKKAEDELDMAADDARELRSLRKKVQQMELEKSKNLGADADASATQLREELEVVSRKLAAAVAAVNDAKESGDEWKTKARQLESEAVELRAELEIKEEYLKKANDARRQLERDLQQANDDLHSLQQIHSLSTSAISTNINQQTAEGETLGDLDLGDHDASPIVRSSAPPQNTATQVNEAHIKDLEQQLNEMKEKYKAELNKRLQAHTELEDAKDRLLENASQLAVIPDLKQHIQKLAGENDKLQKQMTALATAQPAAAIPARTSGKNDAESLEKLKEHYHRLKESCKAERRLMMSHFYAIAKATHPTQSNAVPFSPLGAARRANNARGAV